MVDLTVAQKEILQAVGHQLVTGGPGSGKTTVSILNAAKIARLPTYGGVFLIRDGAGDATVRQVVLPK